MKKFYGIRNKETKEPLYLSAEGNGEGEFCGSYSANLDAHGDVPYLNQEKWLVEGTLTTYHDWYNSSLETPSWPEKDWNPALFEIFEVEF